MAYLPRKARSELVLVNRAGWGTAASRRMFHAACPASCKPARRPTRGSGFGSPGERLSLAAPVAAGIVFADCIACEQPSMMMLEAAMIAAAEARASPDIRRREVIGGEWVEWYPG